MSFNCKSCKKHVTKAPNRIVVEYYPGGKQIKKEVDLCDECAKPYLEVSDEELLSTTDAVNVRLTLGQ